VRPARHDRAPQRKPSSERAHADKQAAAASLHVRRVARSRRNAAMAQPTRPLDKQYGTQRRQHTRAKHTRAAARRREALTRRVRA
jgi:hypothetical protein